MFHLVESGLVCMTSPRASTVEEEGAEREEVEARLEAGPGLLLETGFTFRIWGRMGIRGL